MRRPAHAAGYSWRKWEDPIMAKRLPMWEVWGWCIAAGMTAAIFFELGRLFA